MKKLLIVLMFLVGSAQAKDEGAFYLGGGYGFTYSSVSVLNEYYLPNDKVDARGRYKSIAMQDSSYNFYAGYQFNNIVEVELSYKDYGTLEKEYFTENPYSIDFSANLGYNFLNNQFRPFVIVGAGYMYSNSNVLEDNFTVFNLGFGGEYYPTSFKGVGFRLLAQSDSYIGSGVAYDPSTNRSVSSTLFRYYYMYSVNLAYRF